MTGLQHLSMQQLVAMVSSGTLTLEHIMTEVERRDRAAALLDPVYVARVRRKRAQVQT